MQADTTRPSSHSVGGRFEVDRFESGWVVGSDWTGDHVEESGAWWTYAKGTLGTDHIWPDVKAVASFSGSSMCECIASLEDWEKPGLLTKE